MTKSPTVSSEKYHLLHAAQQKARLSAYAPSQISFSEK